MQLVATSRGCDFIISTGDNFYPDGLRIPSDVKDKKKYTENFLKVKYTILLT